MTDKENDELIESLRKSKKGIVGELYPVLEASDGEIVDGFHRKKAGWESKKRLKHVTSKLEKLVARALAHQRRTMSFKERRALYDGIAEELIREGKAKPDPQPNLPIEVRNRPKVIPLVAELLGVTEHTVGIHISDSYKRGTVWKKPEEAKSVKGASKRSIMEIRVNILECLSNVPEGTLTTPLMYRSNLSWNPLRQHLAFLYKKRLVEVISPGEKARYLLTSLGKDVWKKYLDVKEFLLDAPQP